MNALSHRRYIIDWSAVLNLTLAFWLSGILILDTVIIPTLSAAGMMVQPEFASVGYLLFGLFNRIELISAALILASFLALQQLTKQEKPWTIILGVILLIIASVDTYILAPQMSGFGMILNLFESHDVMSSAMISYHEIYWLLEVIKLVLAIVLLRHSFHSKPAV